MTQEAPRLRVERLAIVESRSPVRFIRDVRLRAGLNIVWAQELPAADGVSEIDRAGHGVGKSTFSLMLRAVLGDDGAAVKTMRGHLAAHYGSGGIAAEVIAGSQRFAVFRSFGSASFALRNGTVESLFEENAKTDALDFSAYVTELGEQACLRHMSTRALPVTSQAVEWGHVLCWIARDQALGLRQYFEWRNDDGTGLRRKRKDPPALVRLALGLFTRAEAEAEERTSSISEDLVTTRETLESEKQRGANTRNIVETQLRSWAGVSKPLQMVADDLFTESVEKEIRRKAEKLEAETREDRAAIATLDRELILLAAEIQRRDRTVQLAQARWEETVALRSNDEQSLTEIRERRDTLLTLAGTCDYGRVAYNDCRHVQDQKEPTVKLTVQRDAAALSKAVDESQEREAGEKADHDQRAKELADVTGAQEKKNALKVELTNAIDERSRSLGRVDAIRETLAQWQEGRLTPETETLRAARDAVVNVERKLAAAKAAKVSAQHQGSERERQITAGFATLARAFGSDGRYEPSETKRPFQMLRADGDAFTVLEIVLGDVACAEDGAKGGGGAHPGFLIFDCPREREMSPHLYDRFLSLVDEICRKASGLQIIITTTTPPPERLREPPACVLTLSRASDEDLLLKRRIENVLSRSTPTSSDADDEDDP